MAVAKKPDSHRLTTMADVATRFELAYDICLTAACLFPQDVATPVGLRDGMHKAVDKLEELSKEFRKLVDEGEVWFG